MQPLTVAQISPGPLAGIKVIDFGQYVAGPGAAMMLADQGAEVVRVEMPEGPMMKSPANAVLNRRKSVVRLDLKTAAGLEAARALVREADVLIENFRPFVMTKLGLGPDAVMQLNPRIVYLSLPGFSANDPINAGIAGWEAIVAAAMGQFTDMGLNRVLMGIKASYSPLTLASAYAAVFGCMGVVLALRARDMHGRGDHIEASLAAAVMEGLVYNSLLIEDVPARYLSLREREIIRRKEAGLPLDLAYDDLQAFLDPFYRSYRCRDGRPFYVVSTSHVNHSKRALQVLGLWDELLATGIPDFDPYLSSLAWPNGADCTIRAYPITQPLAAMLSARMAETFLTRDSQEWERLFGEAGAPAAAHRTTREWVHSDHARQSGLIVEAQDPEFGTMLQPGPLFWLEGCPPAGYPQPQPDAIYGSSGGAAQALPGGDEHQPPVAWLEGITILDLTNVIAGPTIAGTLARFGARVIKIDDVHPTFDPWNTVVMGIYANRGKESALIDLKTPAGRDILHKLLARVDVVTMNATETQATRLGLDMATLMQINPRLIVCRLDAYGGPLVGPRSAYPGYDDLVQASTGIMERFGGSFDTVEEHAHFGTIDVMAGLGAAVAIAVALLRREKTGRGELAMSSLAAAGQWLQSRFMYDFAGRPPFDEPRGRSAKGETPFYRCYEASDGWFFLAAKNGLSLVTSKSDLFGSPPTDDPEHLEPWLESVFRSRTVTFWQQHLNQPDVTTQPLRSLLEVREESLSSSAQARTIRFECHDHHPSGHRVAHIDPTAIRPANAPILKLGPLEKYGKSTRRILRELGLDENAINGLNDDGIISDSWSDQYMPD